MSNSLMERCKHHITLTIFIVLIAELILACLIWFSGDWFFAGSIQTFGPPSSYVFIWLSIAVASIAALTSMFSSITASDSLKVTRESLELTRSAIRPFVSSFGKIPVSHSPDTITLTFQIRNSGSIPSSNVYTSIDFFDEDEEVTADNLSNKYRPADRQSGYGLMLPNDTHYERFILDLKDKGDIQLWQNIQKGKVKVRLHTTYESLGRKHSTLQTEQIVKLKGQTDLQLIPAIPQEWD